MLSGHNHIAGVVDEPFAQMTTDLLGTPALRQQLTDHLSQLDLGVDSTPMVTRPPNGGTAVRLERRITLARRGIAAQLAWDRRRRTPDPTGDLTHGADRRSRSSCERNRALISRTSRRSNAGTNPTT